MENTIVRRRGEMVEAEVDGQLVGLDIERGSCYGFNRSATRVWQLLDQPRSVGSLRDALLEEFDVDPEECERDLVEALEKMRLGGLIESSGPLLAAPAGP